MQNFCKTIDELFFAYNCKIQEINSEVQQLRSKNTGALFETKNIELQIKQMRNLASVCPLPQFKIQYEQAI